MRGIISAAGYLPHWRLQREAITEVLGTSAGKGQRSVASYDEDSLTMAVEAGRHAIAAARTTSPTALWFCTTSPTYAEKTNATIAHAALRLGPDVLAADAGSGLRGPSATLRSALYSTDPAVLLLAADVRTGPAGSVDEKDGGDAAAALLIGEDSAGSGSSVIAEFLGSGSATREFLDRWRSPGELRTRSWEDRFGEQRYAELAGQAWKAALKNAGVEVEQLSRVALVGPRPRACAALAKQLGAAGVEVIDSLASTVGFTGAAHPFLLLTSLIEQSEPGQVIAMLSMADGADAFIFRVTEAMTQAMSSASETAVTVAEQVMNADNTLLYSKYLSWRQVLPMQPPNRPEPARMSAAAAERRLDWKYGFVGSRDRESSALHLPPARVSFVGGNLDDMDPAPMADVAATIATFTVDSLAYSPSPPVVFAVCDFDGGGRLPVELTDVRAAEVSIGMKVEMTFRRLNTSDEIANYFWKARPVRGQHTPVGQDTVSEDGKKSERN
ncbi:MAG: OB-fold domain-containing protein [Microthrixaceae bacterium]